jgi:hypothetical protein
MLHSASLAPKYWEYAFYFFLRIHMLLSHGKNQDSPYFKATLMNADFSLLHTFGCHIYALGTQHRYGKLATDNIVEGIFLGYGSTTKTFIYQSTETNRICHATHAIFDEADLNSNPVDLTPNSCAL